MILLAIALGLTLQLGQKQQELTQLKSQIDAVRQELKKLEKEKVGTLTHIEKLDESINLSVMYIDEVTSQESDERNRVRELTVDIAKLEDKMKVMKDDIRERLVRLYKWTPFYKLEVMFSGKSLPQILSTSYYLQILAQDDQKRFFEFKADWERYLADKKMREDLLKTLEERRLDKEDELSQLNQERREKNQILDKVGKEEKEKKEVEKELKSAQRKLEELVANLEKQREKTPSGNNYLEVNRGRLMWPCEGSVTTKFGKVVHPKYNTTTKNNGIDIVSGYGNNVFAVAPGKVVYAGRFMGYGNLILLDHQDGYYSLYGHLSEMLVKVGDEITKGRIIGRIGESGSLSGPLLHFELRKDGKPVDPLIYLE
jgi:septal ring factor EnvC (AmiA/AmiB activator)